MVQPVYPPILRGTGNRVQTIVLAKTVWESDLTEIAKNYDLSESQVREALAFYESQSSQPSAETII